MIGLPEVPTLDAARERAEKALSVPLGFASPLWVAFGAAAGMGVAWWWMTRWSRAVNLEAMLAAPPVAAPPVAASTAVEPTPAAVESTPVAAPAAVAPTLKSVAPSTTIQEPARPAPPPVELQTVESAKLAPAMLAAASPSNAVTKPALAPVPEPTPDDLTRLVGIGAKLAAALAERGVTRFEQIAKWKEKDLARVDADLKLLGRATRDAWVAQAKRLAAES